MIVPRQYQEEAEASIFNYYASGKAGHPVVAMPTASGKSIVIANFCKHVLMRWPRQRIIVATHVKELIEQNFNKMLDAWPEAPAGIHSAGLNQRDVTMPIIFGGIQSMVKNAAEFGWRDLLIVDEAHLISGEEDSNYSKFITALSAMNSNLKVIGFSATPYRLKHGLLADGPVFTDVCFDITSMAAFNRLIDEGYLCPLIPKRTGTELNVSDVRIQNGDYIQNQLQAAVDKEAITFAACREIVEQGSERHSWLIFASGIEHAEHIAAMLAHFGVEAQAVHSKMKSETRDEILRDFKAGTLRCVVNNNVLTTGFDHPSMDLIGMLRPTVSPGLWVQMLGRGTRPALGKLNCLVLDFAGNTKRLGPINDPVIPRKRGEKGDGVAPVKICEQCGAYNHTRAVVCCGCGAKFEFQPKITKVAGTEALLKTEEAKIETFNVSRVLYTKHEKAGSPPSMRVQYWCNGGVKNITEWVLLEHPGMAGRKARDWWAQRMQGIPPSTVDDALTHVSKLREPKQIRVWTNKKYPEVLATLF